MRAFQQQQGPSRRASAATLVLGLLAGALGSAGCVEEQPPIEGGPIGDGPAFMVATRVWDDMSTNSYFHVLPSLEQGTAVDPSDALEVPGSARLFAFEELGWFAIGGGEAPTFSRYTLDDRGALVEGDTVSLQPFGVQSLWNTMYLVSPTKAYYPDRAGEQLVVWNPTTMEVQGTIALPETAREGYLALYGYGSILRGKTLLFSVGWFDWQGTDTVPAATGLVAIDTETDTVARYDVDDRCGGITQPIELESGDAYFVSSALAGAAYHLERLPTEPCALRVLAGEDTFDPDYLVHLGELTGGAIAGDPIPGRGDGLFLRVFDEALATIGDETKTFEITSQPAWHWWRWDPATNEAAAISDLSPSPANVSWFDVDGRIFTIEEKNGSTESTLIELTAEGGPSHGLTAPGYLHAVAKVR